MAFVMGSKIRVNIWVVMYVFYSCFGGSLLSNFCNLRVSVMNCLFNDIGGMSIIYLAGKFFPPG